MSNKIFESIISFMSQQLFDKIIDVFKFKLKGKKNIASGYLEDEYVTIYFEGDKLTIIIPDENLSEKKCHKIAKKIIKKIYNLRGIELELDEIEIKMLSFASGICNFCLIKAFTYKCRRCKAYYCSNHRLPENHNCPGEHKLAFEIKERAFNKKKYAEEEKSAKIIITESHCG
ncbi:MAG: AN1-type zinc finger domain-containing protein [Candidatus Helarchaeota archaeon]